MKYTIFNTPIINVFTRFLSLVFLRVVGWKSGGAPPAIPKFVLIAAPHTSNWDFILMMAFAFLYKLPIHWMGKDSLFPGLAKPVARYLGGIPIDRSEASGMVQQTIDKFKESNELVIAIPPEGTRAKRDHWKSGFYHVAHGAGVPIVLGFLDFAKKVGGFGPAIDTTGDAKVDMATIREFYKDIAAKFPEMKSDIRLEA